MWYRMYVRHCARFWGYWNKKDRTLMEFTVFKSFLLMLLIFIGGHLLLKELVPNELTRGLIGRTSLYTLRLFEYCSRHGM